MVVALIVFLYLIGMLVTSIIIRWTTWWSNHSDDDISAMSITFWPIAILILAIFSFYVGSQPLAEVIVTKLKKPESDHNYCDHHKHK